MHYIDRLPGNLVWYKFSYTSYAPSIYMQKNIYILKIPMKQSQSAKQVLTMSLYRFFDKASKQNNLPDPSGLLSASISPVAIPVMLSEVGQVKARARGEGRFR